MFRLTLALSLLGCRPPESAPPEAARAGSPAPAAPGGDLAPDPAGPIPEPPVVGADVVLNAAPRIGPPAVSGPQSPLIRELADGQFDVDGMAADGTHLYWTSRAAGAVFRVPLKGGDIEELATGQRRPQAIDVSGSTLVWLNGAGRTKGKPHPGALMTMKVGAGKPTKLADFAVPMGLAADATHVYVAELGGSIFKIRRRDGKLVVLAKRRHRPIRIAVNDTHVFWTSGGPNKKGKDGKSTWVPRSGSVNRIRKRGGKVHVVAGGQNGPGPIAADGEHVYWSDGGAVLRANHATGKVVPFGGGASDSMPALALLDSDVVFSTLGIIRAMPSGTAVFRVPLDGGQGELLFNNIFFGGKPRFVTDKCFEPGFLAAAGTTLFVADDGCGTLLSVEL